MWAAPRGCQSIQGALVAVLLIGTLILPLLTDSLWPRSLPRFSSIPTDQGQDNLRFVDPLIGSVNGGHVFSGATLPYGMAKAVADVVGENQGGYASDGSDIMGFSGLHDSGVGWTPSMGNFPIFPMTSCHDNDPAACDFTREGRSVSPRNGSVMARPGYFAIGLETGVFAEMTVAQHTAIYRFNFEQPNPDSFGPVIYLALEDLQSSTREKFIMINEQSGRIQGNGTFRPSFGSGDYATYFCADFGGADFEGMGYSVWPGTEYDGEEDLASLQSRAAGAWVHLKPTRQVLVRIGHSFVSSEKACTNAERETKSLGFEQIVEAAEDAWKEKLSVIRVDPGGSSTEMLTTFWTGVYRSLVSPQDYTGENALWRSKEPYFDSWYCIWDTFRTTHPLVTLLDPNTQSRMVRSLIDIWKHEGRLPDCRMQFSKGYTQGGSNADCVLADSLLKGIDNVDWAAGMKAVLADLEQTDLWRVEGRGGTEYWRKLHYIPRDQDGGYGRSVSRTVEYSYNDLCIAQMAKRLNHSSADRMLKSSHNWEHLFKPNTSSFLPNEPAEMPRGGHHPGEDTGFVGFLQPRMMDGTFSPQDPAVCSPLLKPNGCFLDHDPVGETYEGSLWLYTFLSAPGDMQTLIEKLGGDVKFIQRLDYFHESGLLYFGDEQAFLTAYAYHYAGRPGLSGQRLRTYIPSIFNASVNGLPGNDDSGAMGAFTTLSMLGLFPNAGQDVYLIVPPFFREISIKNNSTGKTATIQAVNYDGSHGKNRFIQSAKLNGEAWTRSWLRHSFFLQGGILELKLGPKETSWGQALGDRPPSTTRDGSWTFMDV